MSGRPTPVAVRVVPSMQMDRAATIAHLRDDNFAGPMIHLRDWAELQTIMHRAADLLQEAEEDEIVRDALAAAPVAPGDETHDCPICLNAFVADDECADDIDMGICHAVCLEGATVVNLETGEPSDGPVLTYRYDSISSRPASEE